MTNPKPFAAIHIMSETPKDIDFINLNDIQTSTPTVPAGEYHVKFMEGSVRESKDKSGYYFNYRVVVQSGEHAGESIFGMWSFKETALWKIGKDFKAMKYQPADGRPHIADLIGFEGIVQVSEKPRRDDPKRKENRIERWLGPLA